MIYFILFVLLALVAGLGWFLYWSAKEKMRAFILRSLNSRLISVALPRGAEKQDKPEKELIGVMEQFYSALSHVKFHKKGFFSPKPYISFEMAVPHSGEEIVFYVSARNRFLPDIQKQIYSYFPKAQISEVEDFNIFNPAGVAVGSVLTLKKNSILPVKTYKEMDSDPLREIANALSRLKEIGEGASLQILIRPTDKRTQTKGDAVSKLMRKGRGLLDAVKEVDKSIIGAVFEHAFKGAKSEKQQSEEGVVVNEELLKAVEHKSIIPQFDVNIRIVASARDYKRAQDILRQVENSFNQFSNPALNSFEFEEPSQKAIKKLFFNFAYRIFNEKERIVLSSEELTGIYHFPNVDVGVSNIREAKSKIAPAPIDLSKEGLLIGRNVYRGEERKIFMTGGDRRRHTYIIGQTGTGKTALIKNMVIQDIRNGEGVGLIDPHGDIAEEVMGFVPEDRYKDVVVIDPSDLSMPIGLNMLEFDPRYPEQKTFIVNEIINILDKLYDLKATGGPMFEQYTRNALMLLMEYPDRGYTLLEIPKVLSDREFRNSLLEGATNILVKDFWEKEAEKAGGEAALANMVPYITSKFNVFLANDYIRPIIAQSKSTINFREIMDSKKILIVNLAKGRLGDINASLLGLIIVGKLLMAAFSRVDMPEEQRKDFYLYIDEFQNFATDSIATILSEARKYKLNLIIAHQFIEQLKKEIRDAVFGNVGNIMSLRVGATDAEFLAKQFEPVFDQNDLVNIDNFNVYAKLLVNGKTTKPFSLLTYPPEEGNPGVAASVKRLSAIKYGRDRREVEKSIIERLRPEYL